MDISAWAEKFNNIGLPEDVRVNLKIETIRSSASSVCDEYTFSHRASKCSIHGKGSRTQFDEDCTIGEAIKSLFEMMKCDLITKMTLSINHSNDFCYRQIENSQNTKGMMLIWLFSVLNSFEDRLVEFKTRK